MFKKKDEAMPIPANAAVPTTSPRGAATPTTSPRGAAPAGGSAGEARVRKLSKLCGGLVAVAVAGAGLGAYGVATSAATTDRYEANSAKVLVASADVKAGEVLTADKLAELEVPATFRSDGSLTPDDSKIVKDTVATVDIAKNQQITASMTANASNESRLSASIDSSKVTVTYDSDASTGMAGLLRKGDHIWLFKTVQAADGSYMTQTVVDDCTVVALGSSMKEGDESGSGYASVTVAVTPDQAREVEVAKREGTLAAALLSSQARDVSTFAVANAGDAGAEEA